MTLLTWHHGYSVGVRAMDDQHGIIMDSMNELRLAMSRGASQEEVNELLDLVFRFTRLHFFSEEQLMEQHGYPGLVEHRVEHQRLMGHIRESVQRAQYSKNAQMRPLVTFLCDWFAEHTEGMDQQYGEWLNAHGVF